MEDLGKKYQNKIGVILTNLGTPKSPLRKDVKKYLNQFLLDRRVVDINRLLWVPLLKLIDNAVYYEWERLDNKIGFWRELKDQESVPVGSEVSMNFETGKNMLKL